MQGSQGTAIARAAYAVMKRLNPERLPGAPAHQQELDLVSTCEDVGDVSLMLNPEQTSFE